MSEKRAVFKVVGIYLIKNEDVFIERSILNVLDFCDEIYVEDNHSTDDTFDIVTALVKQYPKIKLNRIDSPLDSHRNIDKYCNTKTWVFGIDGDEVYDKKGLVELKQQLQAGKYSNQWIVFGNVLHCTKLDREKMLASGYLCPPAKSMTKLYNFSIIKGWFEISQRLHGIADFHEGYSADLRYELFKEYTWEEASFRCLHMPFVRRSSVEEKTSARITISEKSFWKNNQDKSLWWKLPRYMKIYAAYFFYKGNKGKNYQKGEMVIKPVEEFFT